MQSNWNLTVLFQVNYVSCDSHTISAIQLWNGEVEGRDSTWYPNECRIFACNILEATSARHRHRTDELSRPKIWLWTKTNHYITALWMSIIFNPVSYSSNYPRLFEPANQLASSVVQHRRGIVMIWLYLSLFRYHSRSLAHSFVRSFARSFARSLVRCVYFRICVIIAGGFLLLLLRLLLFLLLLFCADRTTTCTMSTPFPEQFTVSKH